MLSLVETSQYRIDVQLSETSQSLAFQRLNTVDRICQQNLDIFDAGTQKVPYRRSLHEIPHGNKLDEAQ